MPDCKKQISFTVDSTKKSTFHGSHDLSCSLFVDPHVPRQINITVRSNNSITVSWERLGIADEFFIKVNNAQNDVKENQSYEFTPEMSGYPGIYSVIRQFGSPGNSSVVSFVIDQLPVPGARYNITIQACRGSFSSTSDLFIVQTGLSSSFFKIILSSFSGKQNKIHCHLTITLSFIAQIQLRLGSTAYSFCV